MKKLFMAAAIFMVGASSVMAQKGEKAVGVNVNYGSEIKNVGIGAKLQYGITDAIRIEPAFNYYLEKDHVTFWDIDANLHYLFNVSETVKVYPLAGVGYAHSGFSYEGVSTSSGDFAINVGAGAEYQLNEKFSIGAELKYQIISNFNQIVFGVGATYKF